jgi:hypothetical protein
MRKALLLLTIGCGLWLAGCASTYSRSNTVRTLTLGPDGVRTLPVTADLNISPQKSQGEARGALTAGAGDEDRLIREAVARALGQDPPRPEGADVLVAMNVFKELNGNVLKVTVTGYPAWYHNFRNLEKEPGDSAWLILLNGGGAPSGGGGGAGAGGGGGLTVAAPKPFSLRGLAGDKIAGESKKKTLKKRQFGLRAEPQLNLMNDYDPGIGAALGPALKYPVSDAFGISSGLNLYFGYLGFKTEQLPYNDSYQIETSLSEFGLSVPVFAQYVLPVGFPLYLEAGVLYGLVLGGTTAVKITEYGETRKNESDGPRSGSNFGYGVGAGCVVAPNVDIGLRWVGGSDLSVLGFGVTWFF